MSVDTSVIIIVSKYQEKKVTAVDFIAVFVRKYTLMCAYMCLYSNIIAYVCLFFLDLTFQTTFFYNDDSLESLMIIH